jgi:hypothetical protein
MMQCKRADEARHEACIDAIRDALQPCAAAPRHENILWPP